VVERMKRENTERGGKKEKCVREGERHKERETQRERDRDRKRGSGNEYDVKGLCNTLCRTVTDCNREAAVISMMLRVFATHCAAL